MIMLQTSRHINVSNMNDLNLSILTSVVTAYTLVGFKWAENYKYKVSKTELPNRGKSFDLEYKCLIAILKIHIEIV